MLFRRNHLVLLNSRHRLLPTTSHLASSLRFTSSSSQEASPTTSSASDSQRNQQQQQQVLELRIKQLEDQLRVRDNIIREFISSSFGSSSANSSSSSSSASSSDVMEALRNPHNPDCGRFVVSTGAEIASAVANGANHLLLDATKISNQTVYLPHELSVTGDHVLMIETLQSFVYVKSGSNSGAGLSSSSTSSSSSSSPTTPTNQLTPPPPEASRRTSIKRLNRISGFSPFNRPPPDHTTRIKLVGNWKLSQRVKFHSHDLDFSGDDDESKPLFMLSSGASIVCHNCYLGDAREAVYLSSSTSATLTQCCICNNVRGIFESYRSVSRLIGCEFDENYFHAVLLSKDANVGATTAVLAAGGDKDMARNPHKCRLEQLISLGNEFYCKASLNRGIQTNHRKIARGDVCFTYNPMLDFYEDVYSQGAKTVLRDSEATTGLVDQSW